MDINWTRFGPVLAIIVVLIAVASLALKIVPPGHRGVVMYFGAVQEGPRGEGRHVVIPVMTTVQNLNVRVQKMEDDATASSKDLQNVTSKIALNYALEADKADQIFQEVGLQYRRTVILPAIQESLKAATAEYTAEELITKRALVKEDVTDDIRKRLDGYGILVTDLSIVDVQFSPEFNRAIEDKQVAEQAALRAENDLKRIKTEAIQVREAAQGQADAQLTVARAEAEAQRLLRQTLTDEIIRLRAIEKWDGTLPQVTGGGGSVPFINISSAAKK